ncbi:MAG: hypothetical protein M1818_000399 [Claussenomyces sp. TS43310]|nr:MAG: hypothetical protein M1818_000399 [Claussenomyces sp. TS43310]
MGLGLEGEITDEKESAGAWDLTFRAQGQPFTVSKQAASTGEVEHAVRHSKGDFIACGASGIVERLPSGDVIKSPWPGLPAVDNRRDLITENRIYKRLGNHDRLVKVIAWDPEECALTMEYMPNGCLKDYLRAHNHSISVAQRFRWAQEAAMGLQLLHSVNVVHCDVEPRNFLLDADLALKIADFSGSSLEGSPASACPGTRFLPPDFDWSSEPTAQDDLFGLGSTIYTIMTGRYPFQNLGSDKVQKLYMARKFPDVREIPCAEIIQRCWRSEFSSAQDVYNCIPTMEVSRFLIITRQKLD